MKKFIFALLAVLMFGVGSYAQKSGGNPPVIELEFGRPSKNCMGFGICKFKINLTAEDIVTLVTAFANPLNLLELKMSPTFYKDNVKSFQNGYLIVEEDYKIDVQTCRAIGVQDNYTIKKGKYQVVYDKSSNTYNCTF